MDALLAFGDHVAHIFPSTQKLRRCSVPDHSQILQTSFGFWSSKVLLTAIELNVFTQLGDRRLTGDQLGRELGLHPRGIRDFFDALVAMRVLERDGNGPDACYRNTASSATFLDERSDRYIGGILKMLNARLYRFWDAQCEPGRNGPVFRQGMLHSGSEGR